MMIFQVSQLDDRGYTALCHTVLGGHLEGVKYLSNCKWTGAASTNADAAMQMAFVLCAAEGHADISMFLLEKLQEGVICHIDSHDQLTGETGE